MKHLLLLCQLLAIVLLSSCGTIKTVTTERATKDSSTVVTMRDTAIVLKSDTNMISGSLVHIINKDSTISERPDTIVKGNIEVIETIDHNKESVKVIDAPAKIIIHNAIRNTVTKVKEKDSTTIIQTKEPGFFQKLKDWGVVIVIGLILAIIAGIYFKSKL